MNRIPHLPLPEGEGRVRGKGALKLSLACDPAYGSFRANSGRSWRLVGRHGCNCNHCDHHVDVAFSAVGFFVLSSQQLLNFVPAQRGGEFFFAANRGLDDLAFSVLQRQDLFLDRVASDELVAGHDFRLADAVRAS